MKKYIKPILEEEKIEIEDIVAASSNLDVDNPSVGLPDLTSTSSTGRWGK